MLGLEGRDDKLYFISVFLTCDEETIERSMHIIADTDDPSLISIKCLVISSFNREACEDIFERINGTIYIIEFNLHFKFSYFFHLKIGKKKNKMGRRINFAKFVMI